MATTTDYIVNLFPNAIQSISKASPAVVTVPVTEKVVSATGTVNIPTATGAAVINTNTVTVSAVSSTIYVGMSVSGTNIGASAVVTGIAGSVISLSVNSTGTGSSTLTFSSSVNLMTTTAGLQIGDIITATDGVGSFGAGTVSVRSIAGTQAILINATSAVTAGTVTDITLPAVSTLPAGLVDGDRVLITGVENATLTFTESTPRGTYFQAVSCSVSGTTLTLGTVVSGTVAVNQVLTGVNPLLNGLHIVANVSGSGSGSTWTLNATPGTLINQVVTGLLPEFQVGETITQATSNATAVITGVDYNGASSTLNINTVSGAFNTTNFVTGSTSSAGMTPTAVVGMTQLRTAGVNNTNLYYVDVLSGNTFALYKNVGLSTAVNSSAFSTAADNVGQYTTFTPVTREI